MEVASKPRCERPLVRYHGGKWELARWIVSHFPDHRIYCEPFAGGASVLLQKPRSYAEVYNDLDVISQQDTAETLFYVDPPYLPETRDKGDDYRHEMTDGDHMALLNVLRGVKGMAILSGYPHGLYDRELADWARFEREALAEGARPRTEVLWMNPHCTAKLQRLPLFE